MIRYKNPLQFYTFSVKILFLKKKILFLEFCEAKHSIFRNILSILVSL